MDITLATVIVIAFVVAGTIKGAIGVGLPTTAIAILSSGIGLREAIPILIIPSFVANVWQIMRGGDLISLLRRFWLLNMIACIGVWLGTVLLFQIDQRILSAILGLVLVTYAAMGLLAYVPRIPPHQEALLTPFVGLGAGLLTGTTGSLLMPLMVYLQALGLEKERFIQATGLSLLIGTIAWAASLAQQGAFDSRAITLSGAALLPMLIGMMIGHWIRGHLSQVLFRKIVFFCLIILGLNLIYKNIL